jgi:hypothetical protein
MEELAPEEFERINRFWYDTSWQIGFNWLYEAVGLKTAADNILTDYLTADERCYTLLSRDITEYSRALDDDINLRLHPVYLLLAGYALENIFKGIIICRAYLKNPQSIDKKNFGETNLAHHGLIGFVDGTKFLGETIDLGLKFNDEEREVMKTLDWVVTWGGRYPISKWYKSNDSQKKKKTSETYNFTDKSSIRNPLKSSYPIIECIYNRAVRELEDLSGQSKKNMVQDEEYEPGR